MNTNSADESAIKIYLLAENRLVREAIVRVFRKRTGLTVAGDSDDSVKALEELSAIPCDVLLLNSLETLRAIKQTAQAAECLRKIKIVLLGMEEDPESFLQAVRVGVCGYLLNDASSAEIIAALRNVMQGDVICPPKLCNILFEYVSKGFIVKLGKGGHRGHAANGLTCRQRQLMALVAKGMTNKEIAASLQLSEFTVKNHIHRIMAHLQADSRHQAVDLIRTGGLFLSA